MSAPKKYVLRRFKISNIKKDRIIFLCGKRGSGKTTGVMEILYRHRDIQMAVVMCGTEESADQYRDYFPDSFIYPKYSEDVLKDLIKTQKKRLAEYKMGQRKKIPYLGILLDDCMFEKPLQTKFMRNVFMNGRHWKILLMITCQYVIDVPSALRGQIDYVLLFKNNNPQEREKLVNIFGGPFPKEKNNVTFNQMLNQCSQNFGCMVIDNTQESGNLEDCVTYFKPERRPTFRIGSKGMWSFHNRHYDLKKALMGPPDEEEEEAAAKKKKTKAQRGRSASKQKDMDDSIVVVLKGIQNPNRTISNS